MNVSGAAGASGATAGASGATAGASGATGTSGGSSEGGLSNAGASGTAAGGALATTSPGCGMALPANVKLGQWTDMADPGNGNPPPIKAGNVDRGYWVYVPASYDKNKPYKVIYQGAGCGTSYTNGNGVSNKSGMTNGSQPVWPFQSVDMGQAIQVGLDYG
ncbi:MAG TPA: hypothetical protein VGF76_09510, partial [Polyangiaceae bacterium]